MGALDILKAIEVLMKLANSAGMNWAKYKAVKDKAESEGREVTDAELESALEDSQNAIDRLRRP
jgi:hypothetical protein